MARLTYIHDTLYWDDKPVNELNYTERGQMGEYVNDMPENTDEMIDSDTLKDLRHTVENIISDLEDLKDALE